MKQVKHIWLIGLGVLIVTVGLSGVVQSARNLFADESDFGQPGLEDLGFVPMAMPLAEGGQQNAAPEIVETPPDQTMAASLTESAPLIVGTPEDIPRPTPTITPVEPERIVIPKIELDAPVIPAIMKRLRLEDDIFEQWLAPDEFAVGWHYNTALLGQPGNTVLNGHHNISGMVFKDLHLLVPGDIIELYGKSQKFSYMVVNVMILPEKGQDFSVRLENARWLMPSEDERVTLITCWPATSNTHRLIIVARPLGGPVRAALNTPQPE